jgi:hypothetical protein
MIKKVAAGVKGRLEFEFKHSTDISEYKPFQSGQYEEFAEELPKDLLIEAVIKQANQYIENAHEDVSLTRSFKILK